jgi:LPPG:FO 2-phospho-L-lactate transferase
MDTVRRRQYTGAMIVVLSGGTGAAKFLQGLQTLVAPGGLTTVVNTGDDLAWWGLHVSPDLDSIMYGLAGVLSRERGWGVEGDTFECLARMRGLGAPWWFSLGDRDLATHLRRTQLLASGQTLSQATASLAAQLGVAGRILPMSDERVETRVVTEAGELSFQEYFVRERHAVRVSQVRFAGAEKARPAPGVLEAIAAAELVIVAPSNPITSIGPILAVPGLRAALCTAPAPVAAISPIVGGAAVSGPAGDLMRAHGLEVSVRGVAQAYAGFLDLLVIDEADRAQAATVEALGIQVHVCHTLMNSQDEKVRLAQETLAALRARDAAPARAS